MAKFRARKSQIRTLFAENISPEQWHDAFDELQADIAPQELIAPLFALLLHDGIVKWRAVTALGMVTARLANENTEAARVVLRRLMWHMNEESGNVAWGIPESMGEILARHEKLAKEFYKILPTYIYDRGKDDNFLDHPPLRVGVYWGMGRLAQVRPELMAHAIPYLLLALNEEEIRNRGMALWALGTVLAACNAKTDSDACRIELSTRMAVQKTLRPLCALPEDSGEVEIFTESELLQSFRLTELAERALAAC